DHASTDAPREREYHDGQVRSGRDARETERTISHRKSDSVPIRSHAIDGSDCNCLNRKHWELNSAVECHPHTVEVIGSNPIAPTISSVKDTHAFARLCASWNNRKWKTLLHHHHTCSPHDSAV